MSFDRGICGGLPDPLGKEMALIGTGPVGLSTSLASDPDFIPGIAPVLEAGAIG